MHIAHIHIRLPVIYLYHQERKRGKKDGRKDNVDYGVGVGNLFFVSKIIGGLRV